MIDTQDRPISHPSTRSLPATVRCPLCGTTLAIDYCWVSPHWICTNGHSYSNVRVLITELAERGWLTDDETPTDRTTIPSRLDEGRVRHKRARK